MTDVKIEEGLENQPKPDQRAKDAIDIVKVPSEINAHDTTTLEGKLPNSKVNPDPMANATKVGDMGHDTTDMEGKLPNSKVNPEPIHKPVVAKMESVDDEDGKEKDVAKMKDMEIDDKDEKKKVEESIVDVSVSEDIKGLLESIDLPQEFKTKALGLFEGAVSGRIADIKKEMFAVNEKAMEEYKTSLASKLEEQADAYVTEAVAKWLEENQTNVKTNVRTQLAESFMANLMNLLESHYIMIPEGKEDVLEAALAKADALQTQLDESLVENKKLKDEAQLVEKSLVVESLVKDLTDTQALRVRELAESVSFTDKAEYETKIKAIVEGISKVDATTKPSDFLTEDAKGESVITEVTKAVKPQNEFVQNLLKDMQRINK